MHKTLTNEDKDLNKKIATKIESYLLDSQHNLIKFGVSSHFLFVAIVCSLFYKIHTTKNLLIWASISIMVDFVGIIVYFLYKKRLWPHKTNYYKVIYNIALILVPTFWGLTAYILMPIGYHSHQFFLFLLIILLSAAFAVQGCVVGKIESCTSLFLLTSPLITWCFLQKSALYNNIAIFIIIYLFFLCHVTVKANSLLLKSLFLRYKNSELNANLEEMNKMLKNKISERTDQLNLAKQAAETANSAKTEFLNIVSSELKSPLKTICESAKAIEHPFAVLIKNYELAKTAGLAIPYIMPQQFARLPVLLNGIQNETAAAFDFIKMLSHNIDKLGSAENSAALECSMANCIEIALERYPFSNEERSLVRWNQVNDFMFIGNQILIIHVLFNLLKNALQYIHEAQRGDITISLEREGENNILRFKDTAKGIPADILPKIFDRYYTRSKGGTGLGLAFCQMVMKGINGQISCESNYGEYTEFLLTFPKLK